MAFYINFDPKLSFEEESLLRKYDLYNKKKKLLLDYEKTQRALDNINKMEKDTSIEKAKETAQNLVKSGLIALKAESSQEFQGFKRLRKRGDINDPLSLSSSTKKSTSESVDKRHLNYQQRVHRQDYDWVADENNTDAPTHLPSEGQIKYEKPTNFNNASSYPGDRKMSSLPSFAIPRKAPNSNTTISNSNNNEAYNRKDPSSYIPKRRIRHFNQNGNPPNNTLYISSLLKPGISAGISEKFLTDLFKIGDQLILDDTANKKQTKESDLENIGSQIISEEPALLIIADENVQSELKPIIARVKNMNFQGRHNRAFLTFESIQMAEQIIKRYNGKDFKDPESQTNIHLIVSYARHMTPFNDGNSMNNDTNRKQNFTGNRTAEGASTDNTASQLLDIRPENLPIPSAISKRKELQNANSSTKKIRNLWGSAINNTEYGNNNKNPDDDKNKNDNSNNDKPVEGKVVAGVNNQNDYHEQKDESSTEKSSFRSLVQYEEIDF